MLNIKCLYFVIIICSPYSPIFHNVIYCYVWEGYLHVVSDSFLLRLCHHKRAIIISHSICFKAATPHLFSSSSIWRCSFPLWISSFSAFLFIRVDKGLPCVWNYILLSKNTIHFYFCQKCFIHYILFHSACQICTQVSKNWFVPWIYFHNCKMSE